MRSITRHALRPCCTADAVDNLDAQASPKVADLCRATMDANLAQLDQLRAWKSLKDRNTEAQPHYLTCNHEVYLHKLCAWPNKYNPCTRMAWLVASISVDPLKPQKPKNNKGDSTLPKCCMQHIRKQKQFDNAAPIPARATHHVHADCHAGAPGTPPAALRQRPRVSAPEHSPCLHWLEK